MKNNKTTPWFSMATLGVLLICSGTARAQRVYLIVDRADGEVQAVSSAAVDVDGYSIMSPAGRLDTDGWNSLTEQAVSGWREANPQNGLLSELNWEGSTPLSPTPVSLGAAYAGGPLFPSEEDVEFQYTTPDGIVHDAGVIYTGLSQLPSITVNRESGAVELANPAGFEITAYSISSPGGGLNPDGLNGLEDQSVSDFRKANPTSSLISELSLTGALDFSATPTVNLGNAFTAGGPEDLTIQYSTPDGAIADGLVNFTGPVADLALRVNLLTGEAVMENQSSFAGPFDIFGYSITSPSGSLSFDNWNSFEDSGEAGAGWVESPPDGSPDAIAELNPTNSFLFDKGKSISLGNILGGSDDLVFEYATEDGSALGTVEYFLDLEPGVTCEDLASSRIGGDFDGDGVVQFGDLVILSDNFGQSVSSYEQGDADCDGVVQFEDLVILSDNFGMSQAEGAVAAAVPEPASVVLAVFGMLFLLAIRKRR